MFISLRFLPLWFLFFFFFANERHKYIPDNMPIFDPTNNENLVECIIILTVHTHFTDNDAQYTLG